MGNLFSNRSKSTADTPPHQPPAATAVVETDDELVPGASSSYEPPAAQALRRQASELQDKRHELARQSREAYQRGDGRQAKVLSNESKSLAERAAQLNAQAAQLTFDHVNRDKPADTIDLHGLRVQEALDRVERRVQQERAKGSNHLVVVVGAGNHSVDGIAKIKPAAVALMKRLNVAVTVDKPNHGCIYLDLAQPASATKGTAGAADDSASCVIM